ncbi:hypothetical protein [Chitinophaga filiformis]|uniref:Uncharacterized protein n=1 Tax=Chitinophaga filiformis TaxID=104663 RepID=A0ABY4HX62_CHIFI|nr:hypothetical protein [Chitinophaga filiformis]UPK67980.1 hypothetical protein MYF79_23795 [Chitinophaga filiformis]
MENNYDQLMMISEEFINKLSALPDITYVNITISCGSPYIKDDRKVEKAKNIFWQQLVVTDATIGNSINLVIDKSGQ